MGFLKATIRIIPRWLLLLFSFLVCRDLRADNQQATLIFRTRIEYPLEARKQRLQGAGTYVLDVDKRGNVSAVHVGISSGHRILDQAAMRSFKQFRFKLGTAPRVRIPARWSLSGRVL